ncbi:unnamed protein product [Tuber melanosporum]|uniref:(Perigord truffle) hypothetical protein n=1 Tax=Tuber melanosporum (strain Mel28) TaxID=656061 RepID=D5GBP6_TUBMM|nr:uncharacterized protein GSTUM_00005512001 [Tuber melanosporum]CAZ81896.1 unnamed protein product [Tuber melanosporum]
MDFFDDVEGDESDEEERMLEEMTRGYILDDFEFNLDSKTALPRQSASTAYSDSTLPRESGSSGYSSGTTWASSVSSAHMLNGTHLTTVTEVPVTPPPPPPTFSPHLPPPSLPPQVPPPPPPLALAPLAPLAQKIKEPLPTLPNPNIAAIPGLAVTKSSYSVRSRRLSALAEPLKVETSVSNTASSSNTTAVPTTLVRGPSPQPGAVDSEPPSEPPPLPPVSPPLNAPPKSASAVSSSRLGASSDFGDGSLPDPPATAQGISGRKLSSPTPPTLEPPGLSVPLAKTVSDDGASGSPARYTPRIAGIPGSLRQIQSSASLKSRNVGGPDTESPGIPHNGLFSSSSASNLRKAFPRSATPATPTIVPNTPMGAPPTAGLPAGGMHLFESKLHSPATPGNEEALSSSIPVPLEPCPPEPLSKPFWLMRCFYQTVAHPRGGYISARLFVPREVWFIKGVKIRAVDDKISACDLVSAALARLARVKHNDIHALYEEMQSLEGVLDRAQTVLSKKLGNEVGSVGARSLYQTEHTISEGNAHDMVTKSTGVTGGKSYFSLRKLRTKSSNTALSSFGSSSNLAGGDFYGSSGLPMAAGATDSSSQPKRNLESVTFGGPHAAYISALARLFDAAQILDRLPVFDEGSLPEKTAPTKKVGLELSHRHAAEFFGFYICRFVLADVSLLLDKFVKRGNEWVAQ